MQNNYTISSYTRLNSSSFTKSEIYVQVYTKNVFFKHNHQKWYHGALLESMSITSIYGIHPNKIKVIQNMNNNDHSTVNEKRIQKIIIINCIVIK